MAGATAVEGPASTTTNSVAGTISGGNVRLVGESCILSEGVSDEDLASSNGGCGDGGCCDGGCSDVCGDGVFWSITVNHPTVTLVVEMEVTAVYFLLPCQYDNHVTTITTAAKKNHTENGSSHHIVGYVIERKNSCCWWCRRWETGG